MDVTSRGIRSAIETVPPEGMTTAKREQFDRQKAQILDAGASDLVGRYVRCAIKVVDVVTRQVPEHPRGEGTVEVKDRSGRMKKVDRADYETARRDSVGRYPFLIVAEMPSTSEPVLTDIDRAKIAAINRDLEKTLATITAEEHNRTIMKNEGRRVQLQEERADAEAARTQQLRDIRQAALARTPPHVVYILTDDPHAPNLTKGDGRAVLGVVQTAVVNVFTADASATNSRLKRESDAARQAHADEVTRQQDRLESAQAIRDQRDRFSWVSLEVVIVPVDTREVRK